MQINRIWETNYKGVNRSFSISHATFALISYKNKLVGFTYLKQNQNKGETETSVSHKSNHITDITLSQIWAPHMTKSEKQPPTPQNINK